MTIAPDDGWDETADRDRPPLRERVIAELYELHTETAAAAEALSMFAKPAARRRYRDAKTAEADLLRAVGFNSWDAFERVVPPPEPDELEIDLVALEAAEAASVPPIEVVDVLAVQGGSTVLGQPAANTPEATLPGEADAVVWSQLGSALLAELASARAELGGLRGDLARVADQLADASIEIVALRLELMVAAQRTGRRPAEI